MSENKEVKVYHYDANYTCGTCGQNLQNSDPIQHGEIGYMFCINGQCEMQDIKLERPSISVKILGKVE